MAFNPNSLTFDQGIKRIQDALNKHGRVMSNAIVTSADAGMQGVINDLRVTNVPQGFSKFQLPVFLSERSQFFFSYSAPDVVVPQHSHDEGDGLRVILHGSIQYEGSELKEGDWMFIPKGSPYSFKVGTKGVGMFYCYSCCCA